MARDTSIRRHRHHSGLHTDPKKTGTAGLNDMTLLILVAVAAACLAGLVLLPVTMPKAARLSAEAVFPAPNAPIAPGKSLPPDRA
ncbi:hypothetical protein MHM88_11720 [Epibacterium sp. MM17-32]|uniref:hypothetical protein n=1 Tax=Epibacterium sp. MM17-32 TaxID=2917734 RepID=UPI001EF7457B|nr:hypothetical protein [Epibacterium sp. MM17-32]MCG7628476.1 hypothetical protein [Epibacterium sp. MM17-32]